MEVTNVKAGEIRVGDEVVERDGSLLKVETVQESHGRLVFQMSHLGMSGRILSPALRPHRMVRVMR